jgi:hypothetical protein
MAHCSVRNGLATEERIELAVEHFESRSSIKTASEREAEAAAEFSYGSRGRWPPSPAAQVALPDSPERAAAGAGDCTHERGIAKHQ